MKKPEFVRKHLERKFFVGELMTCKHCGKQEKSDPHVESQWTVVEIEGEEPMYFCPECFGVKRGKFPW